MITKLYFHYNGPMVNLRNENNQQFKFVSISFI